MQIRDTSLAIRPALRADIVVLGEYGATLVSLHHQWDPDRFIPAHCGTAKAYAGWLDSQLEKADVVILVAEQNRTVVGYTYGAVEGFDYMSLRGPAGVLHDIFVHQDERNKGIGRMLLDAVAAELFERGAPQIVLSTAAKNESAQRLFTAAGFRPAMVEMVRRKS